MSKRRGLSGIMIVTLSLVIGCSLIMVTHVLAQESEPVKPLSEKAKVYKSKPEQRIEWYEKQRSYPYGSFPRGAMHRAWRQREMGLRRNIFELAAPAGDSVWEWKQIGPAPIANTGIHKGPWSGRVRTIAMGVMGPVHPKIYIGAASGGVWETIDGGSTWTPLTDKQPSLSMGSIAVDPSSRDEIIYAGTGEYGAGGSAYGAGILKSTDGGNSWTHIPGPWDTNGDSGAKINKIVVIPGLNSSDPDDDTVFVAGTAGLFRSTQGGSDFSGSSVPVLPGLIPDVAVDLSDRRILYAVEEAVGIYRSSDAGQNWSLIWSPTSPCRTLRGALAIAPTNPNILYAAFATAKDTCDIGTGAIWKTTNAKDPSPIFTQMTTPRFGPGAWDGADFCRHQCWYDLAIFVQPNDPDGRGGPLNPEDIVYVGGVGLFRSTDGGNNWTQLGEPPEWVHVDNHAFAFDSNFALYVGTDGGMYRHPNPATALMVDSAWENLNTNLAITQFYPGATMNPNFTGDGRTSILGGTQDNGSMKYTGDSEWDAFLFGDGSFTAFDYDNPDNVWYWSPWYLDIYKTINNGAGFERVNNGLAQMNNHMITPFIVCEDNSQVLIASDDHGVYRTDDGAGKWNDNSPGLPTGTSLSPTALAFAPGTDCKTYFVGVPDPAGRLFRTTTGGGTSVSDWDDITGKSTGVPNSLLKRLPNRWITDIAVHPTDGNIVYVSFSGFCGNNDTCPSDEGHVWGTRNALDATPGEVIWADLTGGKNFPNVPVNAIVVDRHEPRRLYIGTDLGVYRSLDGGATWKLFDKGLPNVQITDLMISKHTGILVASTYGRSMFRLTGAIYVDGDWTGCESGTILCPFNTISEGMNATSPGGELWIKAGAYVGVGDVPMDIDRFMSIRSYYGTATLGKP